MKTGKMIKILAAGMLLAFIGGSLALAHSYKLGDIAIGHVWAPPPQGDEISVYGPLYNAGQESDALLFVSSPVAKQAGFAAADKDAAGAPEKILLEPGKPVSLASWGVHIRLEGLQAPSLKEGGAFPLTLTFEKAGTLTVEVEIESPQAPKD